MPPHWGLNEEEQRALKNVRPAVYVFALPDAVIIDDQPGIRDVHDDARLCRPAGARRGTAKIEKSDVFVRNSSGRETGELMCSVRNATWRAERRTVSSVTGQNAQVAHFQKTLPDQDKGFKTPADYFAEDATVLSVD